ncbi:Chlorophyllide a oxygenase, chloroplastic [Sesamum angolense]|uniref:Chlorophyllide a oxygenase, chloroplastic n=1 Tax=Sesamum angolense TaxID=2727404 RepID=A0AAE2BLD8_9LAMI|nr:Chlorophyllide a oxygenase, chloroplastic [Sesamum angolense]
MSSIFIIRAGLNSTSRYFGKFKQEHNSRQLVEKQGALSETEGTPRHSTWPPICQLSTRPGFSAMFAVATAAALSLPSSLCCSSKLNNKRGVRGGFRVLAIIGDDGSLVERKSPWMTLFDVEDPRSKVPQYKGKFLDAYQALEVARHDIQYCDWKARQDVLTIMLLHEKVDQLWDVLNPLARELKSIGTLKKELAELQEELVQAHNQVHISEARVSTALDKLAHMETLVNDKILQERNTTESDLSPPTPSTTKERRDAGKSRQRGRSLNVSAPNQPYSAHLKNFWYPVAFSSDMKEDTMVPIECFEEPWVLFRGKDGKPGCVQNTCAHRACPLHLGSVNEGRIQCPYHVKLPSLLPPPGFQIHAEIVMELPVEHGLLLDNLLDVAHAPFTHTSTFAKGWSVPSLVKFLAPDTDLQGYWDPYPIDMEFRPPCMVLSNIGISKPGKIEGQTTRECSKHVHQLHVCLPSSRQKTRLLYRMSLDFAPILKHIPFMQCLWRHFAERVLNEDLGVIVGQQERMLNGASIWNLPVSYEAGKQLRLSPVVRLTFANWGSRRLIDQNSKQMVSATTPHPTTSSLCTELKQASSLNTSHRRTQAVTLRQAHKDHSITTSAGYLTLWQRARCIISSFYFIVERLPFDGKALPYCYYNNSFMDSNVIFHLQLGSVVDIIHAIFSFIKTRYSMQGERFSKRFQDSNIYTGKTEYNT